MIKYTRKEYWELYHMTDQSLQPFAELLQQAAEGTSIASYNPFRAPGKIKLYDTFSDCVKERFEHVYPIMYTEPLDQIPLYINETSNLLFKTIVKWRLSIGK
jgi:hypothetical protein